MRPGAGAEGSTNGATFGRAGAGSAADRRTSAGNVALTLNNNIIENTAFVQLLEQNRMQQRCCTVQLIF